MTTGERIKAARIAAHMTQAELGEKIGVQFSAIHKYESGIRTNLKRDTIAALAKALDVSPLYLLGYANSFDGTDYLNPNDEEKLVSSFRSLSKESQNKVLELIDVFLAAEGKTP